MLPAVAFKADIVADYCARLGYDPAVEREIANYLTSPDNVHPWAEIHFIRLLGTFDQISPTAQERLRWLAFESTGPVGDFAARTLGSVGDPIDRRNLRKLSGRRDVDPLRRRAAIFGAAATLSEHANWAKSMHRKSDPPEVRRAIAYVAGKHPIPPTFTLRRTPEWAFPLRSRLELEGKLEPRRPANVVGLAPALS